MTTPFEPDHLIENGMRYTYQGRVWTDDNGMRLGLAQSQSMTMRFYALHGRAPAVEPPKPTARLARKAKTKLSPEESKAAALRAAIAKAAAAKKSGGSYR